MNVSSWAPDRQWTGADSPTPRVEADGVEAGQDGEAQHRLGGAGVLYAGPAGPSPVEKGRADPIGAHGGEAHHADLDALAAGAGVVERDVQPGVPQITVV
jgi:hypothetical protein